MRPLFDEGDASELCGSLDDTSPSTAENVSPRPNPKAVVRVAGFGEFDDVYPYEKLKNVLGGSRCCTGLEENFR